MFACMYVHSTRRRYIISKEATRVRSPEIRAIDMNLYVGDRNWTRVLCKCPWMSHLSSLWVLTSSESTFQMFKIGLKNLVGSSWVVVMPAFNFGIWEAEAGGPLSLNPVEPGLQSVFQHSQGYREKPCPKPANKEQKHQSKVNKKANKSIMSSCSIY